MKLTSEAIEGFVKTLLWKDFDTPSAIPDFHRELWSLCCSDDPLVAIAAPRGHAKSTAVSYCYVLAEVLFRSSKFVLLVSDTEGQAQHFLDLIANTLQTNTDLRALFGIKSFEVANKTDMICRMEDGHRFRILAKGSEQKVRGLIWDHQRPDLIIGDDLENDEIVMNPERRKKFLDWMTRALLPCRSPKGKVRIVGTILHLDSFLSQIVPLETNRRTVMHESGLKFTTMNKKPIWKSVLYKAHVGSLPTEIKQPSDILWHSRFTKQDFLNKYQEMSEVGTPEAYAQENLNRPLDESQAFFRKSDLVGMTREERDAIAARTKPLLYYAGADLAISLDQKADYTAIIVVGIDAMGMMYVMDVIRERMDARTIVNTMLGLQNRWQLQWFAVEQDKVGKSIGGFLKEEMMKTGTFINLQAIVPHQDKVARAQSMQGRMRIGGVKMWKDADWYPTFEEEFRTFPRGRHDDQVDAFSCIGLALQKLIRANTEQEQVDQEWLQQKEEALTDADDGRCESTGY